MEELVLTDPVVEPEKITSRFKVVSFTMDLEHPNPGIPPTPGEPGLVDIWVKDNYDKRYNHRYTGNQATNMIKQLNTANLTTKSMHKRILEKLSADGVLPGTVTGTPDPPTTE